MVRVTPRERYWHHSETGVITYGARIRAPPPTGASACRRAPLLSPFIATKLSFSGWIPAARSKGKICLWTRFLLTMMVMLGIASINGMAMICSHCRATQGKRHVVVAGGGGG